MKLLNHCTQSSVDHWWRVTFIPPDINRQGRMITYSFDDVSRIINKHLRVIRIRSISRVCQPEVLPDHNAMTIACFEKFVITCLSDPVPYHVKIHIGMIRHRDIIFSSAILKIRLRKSPISATTNKTPAVNIDIQYLVCFIKCHLAYTGFKYFFIGNTLACFENQFNIVQIRIAITSWPPEFWIYQV